MTITVPALPFDKDAFEPYMSARTVDFHYEKHHKGYAKKLNGLIEGTALEHRSLEAIIRSTAGDPKKKRSSTIPPKSGITPSSGAA